MFLNKILPSVPVLNPLTLLLERIGLIEFNLIGWKSFSFSWPVTDDDGVTEFVDEVASVYLITYPSGRRTYRLHEYGMAEQHGAINQHLGPVIAWVNGGPLPPGFTYMRPNLEVIRMRPKAVGQP